MKQLFTPTESAELGLLKNILEEAGIGCTFKNQQLFQTLPIGPFNVELWIINDDDFPRAQELTRAWLHPPQSATGTWTCPKCGQRLKDQFDSCWKCGAKRETTAKLNKEGADE